jgi:hypothetical protein
VNAIGDVNGDGHLDVVFVANGNYSEVWLGSADSVFRGVPNAFPRIDELPTAIALADVDGDGDLELRVRREPVGIFGPRLPRLRSRVPQRRLGPVPAVPQGPFWSGVNTDMVAGDLDGDGDPDLVLGRGAPGSWPNGAALVFINDGTGAFTADSTRLTTPGPGTNDLALFDQDGDGDLDLYCGNVWGPTGPFSPSVGDQLFHNNGAGFFSPVPLAVSAGNNHSRGPRSRLRRRRRCRRDHPRQRFTASSTGATTPARSPVSCRRSRRCPAGSASSCSVTGTPTASSTLACVTALRCTRWCRPRRGQFAPSALPVLSNRRPRGARVSITTATAMAT